MRVYKHLKFDEISIGKVSFQFFSVALWQWGVNRLKTRLETTVALPTMSIKIVK